MEIKNILVTGEKPFLQRHQFLFKAMSSHFVNLECFPSGELYESKSLKLSKKVFDKISSLISPDRTEGFWKSSQTFIKRSQKTERRIKQLEHRPDLVFHVFCMFTPFWDSYDIPYVIYLDYTMALAKKNWSPWAPFNTQKEFTAWFNCERRAYEKASYIFTMSNIVKCSLVEDYGIRPEKIKTVGSAGNLQEPYTGKKTFGNKQILINGSDFERKGGDLVVAAFKQVKAAIPKAKLVIIGKKLNFSEDGIENPGRITSHEEMRKIFLETDLVAAPSRCDPFPTFVMEAMNYGVPCVVSASDGMPEIVDHEVNGIVIDQPTPEVLANRITSLLGDIHKLTELSQNARRKVKDILNWNDIAKNISQVLLTELNVK